jgi:hypothetical protein
MDRLLAKPHRPEAARWWSAALVGVALTAAPGPALANGRYPLSQQLLFDPSNASALYLRATYGILASRDAGASWWWICESGVGYESGEDPMMGIYADGTVMAAASSGLYVTRDGGCAWDKAPDLSDLYVRDVALDASKNVGFAVTLLVEDDGTYDSVVWRSSDSAGTWAALGPSIAPSLLPFTIDVAPSDSNRLYVSAANLTAIDAGQNDPPGVLVRSKDGGATWEQRRIPGSTRLSSPYIAAVHPTNPDVLYVRVRGDWDGANPVQSALLYSNDAGDTWRELFRRNADMLGFALSKDGSSVLVGMGNTRDVLRPVDESVLGLYRATTPGFVFDRPYENQVGCLAYVGDSLYVCGGQESSGFELGVSSDDGTTITPVFEYGSVKGPLECPKGSPEKAVCEPLWIYNCRGLGDCPTDAGAKASSGGGSSGCCGSSSSPGNSNDIGTARSDMIPDAGGWLAIVAAGASLFRRALGRRRGRPTPG